MLPRFVITEFFRTPDEDFGHTKVWYYKNSLTEKRRLYKGEFEFIDIFYNDSGKPHRENGEPAVISSHEIKYFFNGQLHRSHFEPAIINSDGTKEYWVYGQLRHKTIKATPTREDAIQKFLRY